MGALSVFMLVSLVATVYRIAGATTVTISDEDKQTIVDTHNAFRRAVNPTAMNMQQMYWDDTIAQSAQDWAEECIVGHDTNDERKDAVGYNIWIGQNLAGGYSSWVAAITAWHVEVTQFNYQYGGNYPIEAGGAWESVAHYIQVVNARTALVGCGYTTCGGLPRYICNYANLYTSISRPYRNGTTCSDCPEKCVDNLCDCGGKTCKNGGTLDVNTCTCNCPDAWKGDDCSIEKCPGLSCQNGGTPLYDTCTCKCRPRIYTGDDCGTLTCKNNKYFCCSPYPPKYCDMYANIKTDCPVMCGICPDANGVTEQSCR